MVVVMNLIQLKGFGLSSKIPIHAQRSISCTRCTVLRVIVYVGCGVCLSVPCASLHFF